jgi:hypothetical protein
MTIFYRSVLKWLKFGVKTKMNRGELSSIHEEQGLTRKIMQIQSMSSNSPKVVEFQSSDQAKVQNTLVKSLFPEAENVKLEAEGSIAKVYSFEDLGQKFILKTIDKGVKEELLSDSQMMNQIVSVFGHLKKGFNLEPFRQFFRQEAHNETDLLREANSQKLFAKYFKGSKIIIPEVISADGKSGIVANYECSYDLEKFLENSTKAQKVEAQKLIQQFYLDSLFYLKIIHTDPNPGNVGFRINKNQVEIVVYDFGSVAEVQEDSMLAFLKWCELVQEKKSGIISCLSQMGFNSTGLKKIENKIGPLSEIILSPFISRGRYKIKNWNRKERIEDLLGEDRFQFMVSAPIEIFPWMRALKGLLFYSENLTADLYLMPLLQKALKLYAADLKRVKIIDNDTEEYSTTLKISLIKNGIKKVELEFPAMAIDEIDDLISGDVKDSIRDSGIDLNTIVKTIRRSGYAPQEVLTFSEPERELKIELV